MQNLPVMAGKVVRIIDKQVLRDVHFAHCMLMADPKSSLALAENVHCTNCVFLYDGMEVSSGEWLGLMRRAPAPMPD